MSPPPTKTTAIASKNSNITCTNNYSTFSQSLENPQIFYDQSSRIEESVDSLISTKKRGRPRNNKETAAVESKRLNPRSQSVRTVNGKYKEINNFSDCEDVNPYKAIRFDLVNVNDFERIVEKLSSDNVSLRIRLDKNVVENIKKLDLMNITINCLLEKLNTLQSIQKTKMV